MARGRSAKKAGTAPAKPSPGGGGRGRGKGKGRAKGGQKVGVVGQGVVLEAAQSEENSDEYVVKTVEEVAENVEEVKTIESESSNSLDTPLGSIRVGGASPNSELSNDEDDTEQFSLGSVLAKTRTVSPLISKPVSTTTISPCRNLSVVETKTSDSNDAVLNVSNENTIEDEINNEPTKGEDVLNMGGVRIKGVEQPIAVIEVEKSAKVEVQDFEKEENPIEETGESIEEVDESVREQEDKVTLTLPPKKRGRPKRGKNKHCKIEPRPTCFDDDTEVIEFDKPESVENASDNTGEEKATPSKNWTDAIWGPKADPKARVEVAEVLKAVQQIKPRRKSFLHAVATSLNSSTNHTPSSSSGSRSPAGGSNTTTPRSLTPDPEGRGGILPGSAKKASSGSKRAGGGRRRRVAKISDSEDSSVSTDSPLKPKTYNRISRPVDDDDDDEEDKVTPVPAVKTPRIPKKRPLVDKEPMTVEPSCSPEEELPLIPKGFLEQKKKLEDSEAARMKEEKEMEELKQTEFQREQMEKEKKAREAEDKLEVDGKLKSFKHVKENHYLCARKVNKATKKMQCDCTLSKEEVTQGENGCGDDCLNRLLFIECGKVCQLDGLCSNKRFQNNDNANIEVFKTDWKGFGIRATNFIPKDTFLMEYVGEVLDPKQFRKRARQYAKEEVQHFYFMALSKDFYVDATNKGNISRFINHSCDPNSETQKWTVNGELRVGFFTKRAVKVGEEINFDYKYERYGTVAQKCYCGTARCRGWLGGDPSSDSGIDEMEEWSSSEEEVVEETVEIKEVKEVKREERKKKKRRPAKKIKNFEVDEYEEEIERLIMSGIRNKIQTVQLCRLMVRATRISTRLRLADLLLSADQPCLRLFLDYQGLRILSHWMFDLAWEAREELELKLRIESVLASLAIPHKTMLVDSKVLTAVESWALGREGRVEQGACQEAVPDSAVSSRSQSPEDTSRGEDRGGGNSSLRGEGESSQELPTREETPGTEKLPPSRSKELSVPGEGEPLPPGEEGPALPVLAKFILEPPPPPPPPEEEVVEKMPGTVTESVEVAREGEVMVTEEQVLGVMKGQAGVGEEGMGSEEIESEKMEEGQQVEPVGREEVPLTDEQEEKRTQESQGKEEAQVELSTEERMIQEIMEQAKELLVVWSLLQEVFKIPKKERQKVRREHEIEADRRFSENRFMPLPSARLVHDTSPEARLALLQANAKLYASMQLQAQQLQAATPQANPVKTQQRPSYSRGYQQSFATPGGYQESQGALRGGYQGGGRGAGQGDRSSRDRRNLRLDDRTGRLSRSNLYKEDRRMLFQAKVEEENRQKVLRSALSARHTQCCRLLGLVPANTPMLPIYPEFYLSSGKWIPMPAPPLPLPPDWTPPCMAALPPEAFRPSDPPLPNPRTIYPPGICPEKPPPPSPIKLEVTDGWSYEEICAYYDRLYYLGDQGTRSNTQSLSPSPSPASRRRSRHSKSPSSGRTSRTSNHSSPGLSPTSVPLPHPLDLSPDYRSPSPVQRSPSSLVRYPRVSSPPPRPDGDTPRRKKPRLIPTSIPFLDSNPDPGNVFSSDDLGREDQACPLPDHDQGLATVMSGCDTVGVMSQSARDQVTIKLPQRWKAARDSSGRIYYYHVTSRQTQWEVPLGEEREDEEGEGSTPLTSSNSHNWETVDTDDEDAEGEDTDTEEDSDDEEMDTKEGEVEDTAPDIPDSDLSASEKRMLLRMRGRTKEERTTFRRMKKERDKERREAERRVTRERHTRHRQDGLVVEHIVPARVGEKDKADLMDFKEMRERLLNKDKIREQQMKEEREEEERDKKEERVKLEKVKREEMKERRAAEKAKREEEFRALTAGQQTIVPSPAKVGGDGDGLGGPTTPDGAGPTQSSPGNTNSKRTTQAAADTSSDVEKKHKEKFVKEMSKIIVKILDPYRKKGVRGYIGNTEDFKHLAKKLTYSIMHKELKQCKSIEELKATEKVKKKASEYVAKYMKKYEREYKKSPE